MRTHLSNLLETQSTTPPLYIEQFLEAFEASTRQRDDALHNIIRRVEEKMQDVSPNRHSTINRAPPPPYSMTRRRPSNRPRGSVQQVQSVAMQVTTRTSRCGDGRCQCSCHSTRSTSTPRGLLDRLVGQFSIGYTGLSALSPSCNISSCEAKQAPEVTAEYWFPMGLFWSMIVQFNLSYQVNVGPQFELKTLRRVPDFSACVNYTVAGDIEGLKGLFKRGTASPRDVSDTRGYSLLRVSDPSLEPQHGITIPALCILI